MRFSMQPGAGDDGSKRQQQPKFARLNVIKKVEQPHNFRSKYPVQIRGGDFFQTFRMVIPSSMQHGCDRPKFSLEALEHTSYRIAINQICREIAECHTGLGEAAKTTCQFC